jgi:hypothetical protein
MSDNYEFEKPMQSQATDDYSPYVDKQANGYINDINNGVYTNNSLTLVNFDLGQIYNSQKFTDTNDLFVVLPITMVAVFSDGSATKAPVLGGSNLCSIKTNFINLIHQVDLMVNGKTIESTQPYINVVRHFQLLSEMSVNDLATLGHSFGFSPTLDNTKSMKYNSSHERSDPKHEEQRPLPECSVQRPGLRRWLLQGPVRVQRADVRHLRRVRRLAARLQDARGVSRRDRGRRGGPAVGRYATAQLSSASSHRGNQSHAAQRGMPGLHHVRGVTYRCHESLAAHAKLHGLGEGVRARVHRALL